MTIIEAVMLGALQGLTEFIPVSSSGHLVLAERALGITVPYVFSSLINLGTFLALVIYFRRKLVSIGKDIVVHKNIRLARNIIISAVPVGIFGLLFEDFFAQTFIQQPLTVAIMLALLGVLMLVIEKLPKLSMLNKPDDLTPKRAGLIGVAQAVALLPGTSRSAVTMIAGRLAGLSYRDAAEYSFLLSIPVMFAVVAKSLIDSEGIAFIQANALTFIISNGVAFATGLFAVGFMLRYLQKGNFRVFGWYRLALAAAIVIMLIF
jgi:undecaprenyl-diphosphatase